MPENQRKVKKVTTYWFDDPEGDKKKLNIVFYENGVICLDMQNKTRSKGSYKVFWSRRTAKVVLDELRKELG